MTTDKMNIFSHLENLTTKKVEFNPKDDNMVKTYLPYMINRFISMCEVYIPICNEINKYSDLPKETHYRYYNSIIPTRKQFFQYIKKQKDVNEEEKKVIMEYFECGNREAENYINILTQEQIKEILNKYIHGVK